jgi:SAM-dependent methyltransferase
MSSLPSAVEPHALKAAIRNQWDQSARGWDGHGAEIRAWLATVTGAMLDMAGIGPGDQVLDVAAGAGDQTLDIARRVGPGGSVLATDLSPVILSLAQDNARRAGLANVQTQVADGEHLPLESARFDAAVCRLGLMLFLDPLQGLHEMHRVCKPGAGVCTIVFSRPDRNPCITLLMQTALKHAGLPPRDPYQPGGLLSLGKPGLADELFKSAGFKDVASTTMEAPFRLPSAKHYLDFIRSAASPILQILDRLEPAAAQAAWAEIEERLASFQTASGWVGPNELLLTAARR